MAWVWIIVLALVGGVVMLGWFAVRLWRKLALVATELAAVESQLDTALGLVERIGRDPAPDVTYRSPGSLDLARHPSTKEN